MRLYAPKKEMWRSLRTKSHKEAVQRYRVELLKLDQEFELARARSLEQPKTSLSDTDLQRIKALYIHETLTSDDTFREEGSGEGSLVESIARQLEDCGVEFSSPWSADDIHAPSGMSERDFLKAQDTVETLLPVARQALARGHTQFFDWEHNEFLKAQGYDLPQGSKEFRKASLALLEATVEALEAQEARLQGKIINTPEAPSAASSRGGDRRRRYCVVASVREVAR